MRDSTSPSWPSRIPNRTGQSITNSSLGSWRLNHESMNPKLPPDDQAATNLRGFGPSGILAILIILAGNGLFAPLGAILVLVWTWRSHTPWREIGYVRPRSWTLTVVVGIVF